MLDAHVLAHACAGPAPWPAALLHFSQLLDLWSFPALKAHIGININIFLLIILYYMVWSTVVPFWNAMNSLPSLLLKKFCNYAYYA